MNSIEKLIQKRKNKAAAAPEPPKEQPPQQEQAQTQTQEQCGPQTVYIEDSARAEDIVSGMSQEEVVGLDIETMPKPQFHNHPKAGLSPHLAQIRLIQVCPDPSVVYVFDIPRTGLEALTPLWDEHFVAHNAVFEIKTLYHMGVVPKRVDCTMLMYNAIYNVLKDLKHVSNKALNLDMSKEMQNSDWSKTELTEEQIRYAAMDAWAVKKLFDPLMRKIRSWKRESIYSLMQAAQSPVAKMEYYGSNLDAVGHVQWKNRIAENLKHAREELQAEIGTEINPNSTKQVSNFLKANLDQSTLNRWQTNETGDLSLNKDVVSNFSDIKMVRPLAEYKKLASVQSNFGDKMIQAINPETGRIHPEYSIAGAKTGRFSCSKPNLQNIPNDKELRSLFQAPPGYSLIVADYSQIELRILAILSQETTMLKAYQQGQDLHRLTASKVSGVTPEEVTDSQRQAAKAVNFGLVFGMSASSLAQYAKSAYNVNMSENEAKEYMETYFDTYPGVSEWHKKVTRYARITYKAVTQSGRVAVINKEKQNTQPKNFPVQGSAAEVLLAALSILDQEITRKGLDIKIINCVHDEIHLEAPQVLAEEAKNILEDSMTRGMLQIFPEAETQNLVEAGIGKSWEEAK